MKKSKILSELIYAKTGLYISNKNDCRKLSQLISERKLGYLSESTLYRYFLHPNSTIKPYKNTLHILAKFCNSVPNLLKPGELYATACLIGGALYLAMKFFKFNAEISMIVCVLVTAAIRIYSIRKKLQLPVI